MTIRVLIADDQPLMRAALRMCLHAEPDIDVVAEAGDGREALLLAVRHRPDVVLLDIRMPHLDGLEVTRRLVGPAPANGVADPPAASGPALKILVITAFDLDDYLVDALRAGASGFLYKDASAEEVIHAVRVIAAGDAMLAPLATRRLLDRFARSLPRSGPPATVTAGLTKRELTVLQLVSRGWGNAEIARSLYVAPSSVKTHIGHLLAKLGLTDRIQLVIFAYENGLVQPGQRLEQT
jgi:DNA-binding NarL/FixJ family response regulator